MIPGALRQARSLLFYTDEVTVQSVNLKNVCDRQGARKQFMSLNSPQEVRAKLREILAVPERRDQISPGYIATMEFQGYTMQKLIIRREDEVPLPCLAIPS